MTYSRNLLQIFLFLWFFPFCAEAGQRIPTAQIENVAHLVKEKETQVDSENILVVFDVDNTLIALNQSLGSDQWFSWQSDLIKNRQFQFAVAQSLEDLLTVQRKIFALSQTHPVQKETVPSFLELKNRGIKSIVLTSRGPELRGDTERELLKWGLDFSKNAFGPENGYAGTFLPEGIESPRPISYMNGIIMGSGQHKGKILKAVLKKTAAKFKLLVFVDDTLKNIENIESEFKTDTDLYTFYYTHEEARVKAFEKNKTKAIQGWTELRPLLIKLFPDQPSKAVP